MTQLARRLSLLSLPFVIAACGADSAPKSYTKVTDAVAAVVSNFDPNKPLREISKGKIQGDFGDEVRGANADVDDGEVYDDGESTQLTVLAPTNTGKRVMLQLSFYGDTNALLVPGARFAFSPNEEVSDGVVGMFMACAGDDVDGVLEETPFDAGEGCALVDVDADPTDPDAAVVSVTVALTQDGCDAVPPGDVTGEGEGEVGAEGEGEGEGEGEVGAEGEGEGEGEGGVVPLTVKASFSVK